MSREALEYFKQYRAQSAALPKPPWVTDMITRCNHIINEHHTPPTPHPPGTPPHR